MYKDESDTAANQARSRIAGDFQARKGAEAASFREFSRGPISATKFISDSWLQNSEGIQP